MVLDGVEDEADVVRVGGAGEVIVDELLAVGVQVDEHVQDELLARLHVPLRTCIGWGGVGWGGWGGDAHKKPSITKKSTFEATFLYLFHIVNLELLHCDTNNVFLIFNYYYFINM